LGNLKKGGEMFVAVAPILASFIIETSSVNIAILESNTLIKAVKVLKDFTLK
jgi:hypothetical protein